MRMHREAHLVIDRLTAQAQVHLRRCDQPECAEEGLYRAPKDRDRLTDYYWFCLEHVRGYNQRWNYFAGMGEREIELHRRSDTVWERPTWPLGVAAFRAGRGEARRWRDFFDLFEEEARDARRAAERASRRSAAEEEALAVFELTGSVTLKVVKARYKELVKLHHPDTHGGDKLAEERLKVINQAYTTLKSSLPA
ncbi:MAG: J domain-containing protein [Alphaproteobacteria bacterium]